MKWVVELAIQFTSSLDIVGAVRICKVCCMMLSKLCIEWNPTELVV